jgi:hypothetical protein
VEQRQIPGVEQLEARDLPSAQSVPYLPAPLYFGPTSDFTSPQVLVRGSTTPPAVNEAHARHDLLPPAATGETVRQDAAVPLQAVDAVFADLGEPYPATSAERPRREAQRVDQSAIGTPAPERQLLDATNGVAAAGVAAAAGRPKSRHETTPTIDGVQRYAWKAVSRHRLNDPQDAVQQICLEWLEQASATETTYDDVRRIVSRVIDRAYTRLDKQQRTLELFDVAVRVDAVQESFRDMQLDRDLGLKDVSDQEWQAVGLRRQGYTFAEIGLKLGMPKRRAQEMYKAALFYLQDRYSA